MLLMMIIIKISMTFVFTICTTMRLSPLSSSSSHIYKGCEIEHTLDDGDYDDDDNENAANDDDNDDNNNDNNDNDDKFVSKLRFGFALRPVHQ